jgi:AraC-like DNA-binding protein
MVDRLSGWVGLTDLARLARQEQPHRHVEQLEMNLVTSGSATILIQQEQYQLGKDDLVWLFPDQDHLVLNWSPDFRFWLVFIDSGLLRQLCVSRFTRPLCTSNPKLKNVRTLRSADASLLARLCREWTQSLGAPELEDYLTVSVGALVLRAWAISDRTTPAAQATVHPAVRRALHAISKAPNLSLPALAKRVGMSEAHLSRRFGVEVGTSITEYRARVRLRTFMMDFDPAQQTLLSAALAAGFGSYAQFHRVFRAVVGCSPAEWKRGR